MKFGFNFGFLGKGGGASSNVCISSCGTDGTYWFYDSSTVGMGASNPWETAEGTFFYSFKSDVNGKFIIQWGDAGNEKLPNVDNILIAYSNNGIKVAQWDDIEKYYTFTDLDLFNSMKAEFDAGTVDFCMNLEILPSPFILITYAELMRSI